MSYNEHGYLSTLAKGAGPGGYDPERKARRRKNGRDPYEIYAKVYCFPFPRIMLYRDYLDSRFWRRKQKRAVHRAHCTCGLCGARPRTLHIRHRNHKRLGHERMSDLIALCDDCVKTWKREDE